MEGVGGSLATPSLLQKCKSEGVANEPLPPYKVMRIDHVNRVKSDLQGVEPFISMLLCTILSFY